MKTKGKIVVLGAGESGLGAAYLAKKQGYEVFVSDSGLPSSSCQEQLTNWHIPFEVQGHTEAAILTADEVIKSPGIPNHIPLIKRLHEKHIPVISEIEFGGRYTDAFLIGVTGSNGKTTTSALIAHILKNSGCKVGLAGNIGKSFAYQVATEQHDYYVLELSSFMLDDTYGLRLPIAVLLNISPDHMDRYGYQLESYVNAKFRVTQNQTSNDYLIYCADDPEIVKKINLQQHHPAQLLPFSISIKTEAAMGAFLHKQQIIINTHKKKFSMSLQELALQGKHNLYNSMAAGIVAKVLELRNETIRESMSNFQNIEHRLEYLGSLSNIDFVNDSKATNINATWYALESIPTDVVLLLGGVDKGNNYALLEELVQQKVTAIICLGKDNKSIYQAFRRHVDVIITKSSMQDAVQTAYHYLAKRGDTILLSPACASFDLFQNYEDRGNQFKKAVIDLQVKQGLGTDKDNSQDGKNL